MNRETARRTLLNATLALLPAAACGPFTESPLSVRVSDEVTLACTLSLPDEGAPHPAVILISGSGWQTRDSDLWGFKVFKETARHLSSMNNLMVEDGQYEDFIYFSVSEPASPDDGMGIITGEIRASGPDAYARARRQLRDALINATKERGSFELTFADERFPDMHSDPELVEQATAPVEAAIEIGTVAMANVLLAYMESH